MKSISLIKELLEFFGHQPAAETGIPRIEYFFYFYLCTVHFEDSSIITHQQMHQYYLLFKIGFNP
jgi:hypothetical protein